MSESEHLSGENRMFSAVHSHKRMARVTGFFARGINGSFLPERPKTGRTKIERRNFRCQTHQASHSLDLARIYSFAASLASIEGVIV